MFVVDYVCYLPSRDTLDSKINIQVLPVEENRLIKFFRFFVNCELSSGLFAQVCIGLSKKNSLCTSTLKPHAPGSMIYIHACSDFHIYLPFLPTSIELLIKSYLYTISVT